MASALSLALHMAECAVRNSSGLHAQDNSAPDILRMEQGNGRVLTLHILLVSAEGTQPIQVDAHLFTRKMW